MLPRVASNRVQQIRSRQSPAVGPRVPTRSTPPKKPPKTRNATGERARLPVTSKRYRKPKKIPQILSLAAGSGGLKMRMGNHPLQVSRSHREATGTKCAQVHGMSSQKPPQVGPNLRAGHHPIPRLPHQSVEDFQRPRLGLGRGRGQDHQLLQHRRRSTLGPLRPRAHLRRLWLRPLHRHSHPCVAQLDLPDSGIRRRRGGTGPPRRPRN